MHVQIKVNIRLKNLNKHGNVRYSRIFGTYKGIRIMISL